MSAVYLDAFRNNIDECCQTGRTQAESTRTCTLTLQSLITENHTNHSANCRFLAHICCLSNLRQFFCDEGLKTALRLLPCNETKLEAKDTYQVEEKVNYRIQFLLELFRCVVSVANWAFEQVEIWKTVNR